MSKNFEHHSPSEKRISKEEILDWKFEKNMFELKKLQEEFFPTKIFKANLSRRLQDVHIWDAPPAFSWKLLFPFFTTLSAFWVMLWVFFFVDEVQKPILDTPQVIQNVPEYVSDTLWENGDIQSPVSNEISASSEWNTRELSLEKTNISYEKVTSSPAKNIDSSPSISSGTPENISAKMTDISTWEPMNMSEISPEFQRKIAPVEESSWLEEEPFTDDSLPAPENMMMDTMMFSVSPEGTSTEDFQKQCMSASGVLDQENTTCTLSGSLICTPESALECFWEIPVKNPDEMYLEFDSKEK